jgi:hypothetical protein
LEREARRHTQDGLQAERARGGSERNVLLVGVYIDDLIITGAEEQKVEVFKKQMKKVFDMSNLGLLCFYLGVEVR